jgi:V/A-type H+-transporting ATPase subunit E
MVCPPVNEVAKVDGLEKIKNRILSEAKEEAQTHIKEAEEKARLIREQQNDKALKLKLSLAHEAKLSANDHKKRLIAAAELDMRKALLQSKRQMLESAFKQSISSIRQLPFSEYGEVIKGMLMSLNISGEAEIVFSKADKENFGNGFIEEMNAVLKAIGKDITIKLSQENGEFEGGFILKGKGLEINNTLESLVKLVKDEAEPLAAKVLFADESDREEGF